MHCFTMLSLIRLARPYIRVGTVEEPPQYIDCLCIVGTPTRIRGDGTSGKVITKNIYVELHVTTSRERYFHKERNLCFNGRVKKGLSLSETRRPRLIISVMSESWSRPSQLMVLYKILFCLPLLETQCLPYLTCPPLLFIITEKARARERKWDGVGVMKDEVLKLEEVKAPHTLGWANILLCCQIH